VIGTLLASVIGFVPYQLHTANCPGLLNGYCFTSNVGGLVAQGLEDPSPARLIKVDGGDRSPGYGHADLKLLRTTPYPEAIVLTANPGDGITPLASSAKDSTGDVSSSACALEARSPHWGGQKLRISWSVCLPRLNSLCRSAHFI